MPLARRKKPTSIVVEKRREMRRLYNDIRADLVPKPFLLWVDCPFCDGFRTAYIRESHDKRHSLYMRCRVCNCLTFNEEGLLNFLRSRRHGIKWAHWNESDLDKRIESLWSTYPRWDEIYQEIYSDHSVTRTEESPTVEPVYSLADVYFHDTERKK